MAKANKKHLINVGPIRHCEPLHCHSPGVATRYCRTPPAHRCPRRRQQQRQRQRVTEGTAMAPWNGPNLRISGEPLPSMWLQSAAKHARTYGPIDLWRTDRQTDRLTIVDHERQLERTPRQWSTQHRRGGAHTRPLRAIIAVGIGRASRPIYERPEMTDDRKNVTDARPCEEIRERRQNEIGN